MRKSVSFPLLFLLFIITQLSLDACSFSKDTLVEKERKNIPRFSDDFLKKSTKIFGVMLSRSVLRQAMQIVSNVRRISRSVQKKAFLYDYLERAICRKYGRRAVAKLFGYIDEPPEGGLLACLLQAGARVRLRLMRGMVLPDLFLFAALNNEGLIFSDFSNSGRLPLLNGYSAAGLDWFGSEYRDVVNSGLLKGGFAPLFSVVTAKNELGKVVKTARFRDANALFEAFAATMAYRQLLFFRHCSLLQIDYLRLTKHEKLFWTYFYFNGGPGLGYRVLKKLKTLQRLRDYFWQRGRSSVSNNCFIVLAAMDWLFYSGSFDQQPGKKYWWSGGAGLPYIP